MNDDIGPTAMPGLGTGTPSVVTVDQAPPLPSSRADGAVVFSPIKAARVAATPASLVQGVEAVMVSRNGGIFFVGWVDDAVSPVDSVQLTGDQWRVTVDGAALARVRRPDVEDNLRQSALHPYGYFGFLFADRAIAASGRFEVAIGTKDGRMASAMVETKLVDDSDLRDLVLTYLAKAEYFGNPQIKAIANIDRGLGRNLVSFNRSITNRVVASPYVERFSRSQRKPLGSIVVCLYGKPDYMVLQNALFSGGPGIEDYEFIYICNSPDLAERLLRDAQGSAQTYGIDQTVVILPGNAGFGAANNAAARLARSDRLICLNPDVFPHDLDWAAKHSSLIAERPQSETQLFGATLYYDDGSLMHGGMYFDMDRGLSIDGYSMFRSHLVRVEHYGKGAPPATARFCAPRPVPAVTGAFISVDRIWFEDLGGFSEDYVFGHYEDADLCLKSLGRGVVPWLQDVKMWHLEGKGSVRFPAHGGGVLVNRWLFTSRWGADISNGLLGPAPTHPLLAEASGDKPDRAGDRLAPSPLTSAEGR